MHTPLLVYIHGLNASPLSFEFIRQNLSRESLAVQYDSHQPLCVSIDQVRAQLPVFRNMFLIGHSLGGIIALNLAHEFPNTCGIVTVSSPIGGSKTASVLQYFSSLPIVRDITPRARFIRAAKQTPHCKTLALISTAGHMPPGMDVNDSVVSIASQCAHPTAPKILIEANHFEILQHHDTVRAIKDFIEA